MDGTDPTPEPQAVDNTPLRFDCPRCGDPTEQMLYGPCERCRETLRATITAEAREERTVEYEPKMNVTPNAVALKE
ncbi:MAG: hypothetical protein ACK5O2_14625 [Microthrixaceae bacterium]